jgi:hypothetical protein
MNQNYKTKKPEGRETTMTHLNAFAYNDLIESQPAAIAMDHAAQITDESMTPEAIAPILSSSTSAALRAMIRLSTQLCDLSDQEMQKIAQEDFVGLALMQNKKKSMAEDYAQMSQEFHARLEEFKGSDQALLGALKDLQITLGEKAQTNAMNLNAMMAKLQQNTQSTLLAAQTIAQEG